MNAMNQGITTQNWITAILAIFIGYKMYQLFIQPKMLGVKNISHQELENMTKAGMKPVLIDVRTEGEFKLRHLPGAQNFPLSSLKVNTLKISREHGNQPIVVLCQSGMRSRSGAVILKQAGIKDVYNLLGGMP
jgi:rhodanese-related sulfurtransferase